MEKTPRISVGIPVRNGQRFIRNAIESLLAQTFTDFELIVCDNASTDDTELICRKYAARDPRIRYFRNPINLGPAGNFNKCVDLARGEYFRWNPHDDMVAPEYLAQCVEVLERNPSVVVAYPATLIVDEAGRTIDRYTFHPQTDAADPVKRFAALVLVDHHRHRAIEIFGLMRTAWLRKTPLQGVYARGDSVLLVRLALLGRFVELPEPLFMSRNHASQSMQTLPSNVKNGHSKLAHILGTGPLPPPEWWDPSRTGKMNFPEWNLLKEYWRSIAPAPLSAGQKLNCYGVVVVWLLRNIPKLIRDVLFAIEILFIRRRVPATAR